MRNLLSRKFASIVITGVSISPQEDNERTFPDTTIVELGKLIQCNLLDEHPNYKQLAVSNKIGPLLSYQFPVPSPRATWGKHDGTMLHVHLYNPILPDRFTDLYTLFEEEYTQAHTHLSLLSHPTLFHLVDQSEKAFQKAK